ncbi:MAG: thiamine pyrophosphate-dependent enzyme [Desulfonauticus sp.]|nr:thiamine pyrophosphate-dependent enzyme [Desulfonauticus sp.]
MKEKIVFPKPKVLADSPMHYCPGCQHGTAHKLVAQTLEELNLVEKSICIGSIGCSVFIYNYLLVDTVEAPHGRAPAVATGVKRAKPDKIVFTYQGDGDLASIGLAEIVHCANRGELVTVIFVNNTVYGMTGGQMAPTTMVGQKTTTCPGGRCREREGEPLKMAEMIASLGGTAYAARVAVNNIKNLKKAQKAIANAFKVQVDKLGFGFVEILATCPTNWKMTPLQANKRIEQEMIPYFPLGEFKNCLGENQ